MRQTVTIERLTVDPANESDEEGAEANASVKVLTGGENTDRGILVVVRSGALSGIDIYKDSDAGNFIRFVGPDGRPRTQIADGGQIETSMWMTISGVYADRGPNRYYTPPTNRPYMLGIFSDILGPAAAFRSNPYTEDEESWPLSLISGSGRERLRFTDSGDILMGDIAADPYDERETMQLRLSREGDVGFTVRSNDRDAFGPAYFAAELGGYFAATRIDGSIAPVLRYSVGGSVDLGTGSDRVRILSGGQSVELDGPLLLASRSLAEIKTTAADPGSIIYCRDCDGGSMMIMVAGGWQPVGGAAQPTATPSARAASFATASAPADAALVVENGQAIAVAPMNGGSAEYQSGELQVVVNEQDEAADAGSALAGRVVRDTQQSLRAVAAVSEQEFELLAGKVASLEGRVATMFDLASTIDRDAKRGIAAIAASATPHFPSEDGKTSYASNVSMYRGTMGFSAGIMHRKGDFAITAGVSYAGGNSTAIKAGVAGEF